MGEYSRARSQPILALYEDRSEVTTSRTDRNTYVVTLPSFIRHVRYRSGCRLIASDDEDASELTSVSIRKGIACSHECCISSRPVYQFNGVYHVARTAQTWLKADGIHFHHTYLSPPQCIVGTRSPLNDHVQSADIRMLMIAAAVRLLVGLSGLLLSYVLIHHLRRRARTTPLAGPPSTNVLLGLGRLISKSPNPSLLYEQWAEKYGPVYNVPAALSISRVILCDPKAVSFVLARDTYGFVKPRVDRIAIELTVGRGILYADGDEHKRQRKVLTPAFANASIRNLTPVFYDAAYKVKHAWDGIIEAQSGGSAVIEVQAWMNRISLDTLGIAGFMHDFGTLKGNHSSIAECFDALTGARTDFDLLMTMLGLLFPTIIRMPSPLLQLFKKLDANIEEIATVLLDSSREEKARGVAEDKSMIGLLLKSESSKSALRMSREEIISQMKVLVFAGYVTSSIMLTWCLIELRKKTEVQQRLRDQLAQYTSADPTWEKLTHALPYLDAVIQETVRLHPQVKEHTAVATEDTNIPLSAPMRTASGACVDSISICAGQVVTIPIHYMNMAGVLWRPDAREFRPERWMEKGGIPPGAQEIQGHRHVLTFIDGPRMCLGRGFALAQMKAVLSVLIRSFAFELRDGRETRIEVIRGVNERLRVAGEEGVSVPLRVRRLE